MTEILTIDGIGTADEHPRELTAEDFALMTRGRSQAAATTEPGVPIMAPPQVGGDAAADAGSISGQKVIALWANAADRNAYMYLETAGWKKLSAASDNGNGNLARLAASARQSGAAPYVDEDGSGVVATMYVW